MMSAGAVAARRDRDPPGRPDGPIRPPPHRRRHPRGRRVGRGRGRQGRPTDEEVRADPAATRRDGGEESAGGGLALQPQADRPHGRRPPTAAPTSRLARRSGSTSRRSTRAKLRRLLATLDELTPMTWREGPFTVLEEFVERTGARLRPRRARHARGQADGRQHRELHALRRTTGSRSTRRAASPGSSTTSTPTRARAATCRRASRLTEDIDGVRLMTLYQAKGLEFPIVFVPQLLKDEWPAREYGSGLFPKDLLREVDPGRRHPHRGGAAAAVRRPHARARPARRHDPRRARGARRSRRVFVDELLGGAGEELRHVDRVGEPAGERRRRSPADPARRSSGGPCPCRPRASAGSRCGSRPSSCSSCSRGREPTDPEADGARAALADEFATSRRGRRRTRPTRPAPAASTRCRCGPSRSTPAPGANLLDVAAAAVGVQLLAVRDLRALPAPVRVPARLPDPVEPDRRGVLLRVDAPTPRSRRSRRSAASGWPAASRRRPRRPRAALPGRMAGRPVRRPDVRGDLPAPGRHAARQLLGGRARRHRRGRARGAATSS